MQVETHSYLRRSFGIENTNWVLDDAAAWHGHVTGRPWASECNTIDEVVVKVLSWINTCVATHTECPKQEETLLPNRVIDVGPEDGSQEPRLLVSEGKRGSYITLSHCWGGTVLLTSTTKNIETRKASIAMKELPRTFNDAVILTRRFGVRYLWIDSLCIIQDSDEDWKQESVMMTRIYHNSFLTIAARGAANSNGGCFSLGQPLHSSCQLKYHSPDGSITGSIYVRSPYVRSSPIGEEPLETRAWALQERILSPRVVHFGSQQLLWECRNHEIREDSRPANTNLDFLDSHGVFFKGATTQSYWSRRRLDISSSQLSLIVSDPDSIYQRWYRIAEEYSRRKLTYNTDKVAAIHGLAALFRGRTKDTYYSGLWGYDFQGGLLWRRGEYSPENLNPISSEIPSWSWLRFNGPIIYKGAWTRLFLRDVLGHTSHLILAMRERDLLIYGQLIHTIYKPGPDHEIQTTNGRRLGHISLDYHPYDEERDCWCFLVDNGDSSSAIALELVQEQHDSFRKFSRIGFVDIIQVEKETERRKGTMDYIYTYFDKETGENLNHSTEPFWEVEGEVINIV
jgi:hypothetical protein